MGPHGESPRKLATHYTEVHASPVQPKGWEVWAEVPPEKYEGVVPGAIVKHDEDGVLSVVGDVVIKDGRVYLRSFGPGLSPAIEASTRAVNKYLPGYTI